MTESVYLYLGAHDGVGATIKREATYHSLKQLYADQILEPHDLFKFSERHIKNVEVYWVSKEDIDSRRQDLKERFEKTKTLQTNRLLPILFQKAG